MCGFLTLHSVWLLWLRVWLWLYAFLLLMDLLDKLNLRMLISRSLLIDPVINISLWIFANYNWLFIIKGCFVINNVGLDNKHIAIVCISKGFFWRGLRVNDLWFVFKVNKLRRNKFKCFLLFHFLAKNSSFPPWISIRFSFNFFFLFWNSVSFEVLKSEIEKCAPNLVHRWVNWLL